MKRFCDSGSCRFGQLLDCDHRVVSCTLRFRVHLQKKRDARARMTRLDYTPLTDPEIQKTFADKVVNVLNGKEASHSELGEAIYKVATATLVKRSRAAPLWFAASEKVLRKAIGCRNVTFDAYHPAPSAQTKAAYVNAR